MTASLTKVIDASYDARAVLQSAILATAQLCNREGVDADTNAGIDAVSRSLKLALQMLDAPHDALELLEQAQTAPGVQSTR